MQRISKNQAILLMLLLMVSTIVIDGLSESIVGGRLRTSVIGFSLWLGIFWILEQSGAEKWPKTTLARKITVAGIAALMPFMLGLIRH